MQLLRRLLKQDQAWSWEAKHDEAFKQIQQAIQNVTEIKHFRRNVPPRVICDASKTGLGAVFQHFVEGMWQPFNFASKSLAPFETKYSVSELELLAVVLSIEYFRNYVYGTKFEVVTDHKVLTSIFKRHRGNKTYSSRLTRWVD